MIPSKIAIGAFGLSMFSQGKADTATIEIRGEARHRRVTPDEFSTVINDLSAASRVTAAVSLLNAIMDGKVTPNVALAELLNVGSVDVQKLETFKKENVENALKAIKNLQPNLSATAEGKKLEAMVILLESWRQKFEEIGNVKDIELAKVYYSAVATVQGKTLDHAFFRPSAVTRMINALNDLQGSAIIADSDNMVNLNTLQNELSFEEQLSSGLPQWLASLQQFDDLTGRDFIEDSPQRKFMDLLKNVENTNAAIVTSNTAAQTELSGFVGKVNQELPGLLATDLFHLAEVVSTQSHLKRLSSKTFTAALPNGYLDLDKLDGDVTNPAVKPLLAGFDETTLKNGFAPLKALTSDAADLHQSWSSLNETANVAAGKDLDKLTRWFGAFKANNTATAVKNVGSYGDTGIPSLTFSNTFGTSLDTSIKLRSTLLNVRQKAELLQKDPLMNQLKKFSEMKQYLPTAQLTNVTQVSAALTQFKKFNGSAELLTTLQSLKPHVQSISSDLTNLDLTNTITNLAGGQQALNNFVGHSDLGAVTTYFSGLKGMSAEVESLAGMVQMIKEIRVFSDAQAFTNRLLSMASVVVSSVPKVSVLINVASKINDDANVAKLKKLKDLEDPAKTLGESVLALKNIERVLERKNEFAELLNRSKDVKGLFATVDPTRRPVLTTAWGDIDETEKKVNMTMADLENRINNLPMPTISKFAGYGPVFGAFANLQDLNLESKTRLEVLEELVITQPTVSNVKSKFENLQSLDLHFARSTRPLGTVSSALANLDNIFFAAAQVPVVVTAPPAPVPTASPQATQRTTYETTTPPSSWGTEIVIGGIVFVVVVIVVGAVAVIVWQVKLKPKKSEKDVDLESGAKDGQATATSTPSGYKVDDASTSDLESGAEKRQVAEGKKEEVAEGKKDEDNVGKDDKSKQSRKGDKNQTGLSQIACLKAVRNWLGFAKKDHHKIPVQPKKAAAPAAPEVALTPTRTPQSTATGSRTPETTTPTPTKTIEKPTKDTETAAVPTVSNVPVEPKEKTPGCIDCLTSVFKSSSKEPKRVVTPPWLKSVHAISLGHMRKMIRIDRNLDSLNLKKLASMDGPNHSNAENVAEIFNQLKWDIRRVEWVTRKRGCRIKHEYHERKIEDLRDSIVKNTSEPYNPTNAEIRDKAFVVPGPINGIKVVMFMPMTDAEMIQYLEDVINTEPNDIITFGCFFYKYDTTGPPNCPSKVPSYHFSIQLGHSKKWGVYSMELLNDVRKVETIIERRYRISDGKKTIIVNEYEVDWWNTIDMDRDNYEKRVEGIVYLSNKLVLEKPVIVHNLKGAQVFVITQVMFQVFLCQRFKSEDIWRVAVYLDFCKHGLRDRPHQFLQGAALALCIYRSQNAPIFKMFEKDLADLHNVADRYHRSEDADDESFLELRRKEEEAKKGHKKRDIVHERPPASFIQNDEPDPVVPAGNQDVAGSVQNPAIPVANATAQEPVVGNSRMADAIANGEIGDLLEDGINQDDSARAQRNTSAAAAWKIPPTPAPAPAPALAPALSSMSMGSQKSTKSKKSSKSKKSNESNESANNEPPPA